MQDWNDRPTPPHSVPLSLQYLKSRIYHVHFKNDMLNIWFHSLEVNYAFLHTHRQHWYVTKNDRVSTFSTIRYQNKIRVKSHIKAQSKFCVHEIKDGFGLLCFCFCFFVFLFCFVLFLFLFCFFIFSLCHFVLSLNSHVQSTVDNYHLQQFSNFRVKSKTNTFRLCRCHSSSSALWLAGYSPLARYWKKETHLGSILEII